MVVANEDRLALVASHWPLSPVVQENLVVLGADGRGDDVQDRFCIFGELLSREG